MENENTKRRLKVLKGFNNLRKILEIEGLTVDTKELISEATLLYNEKNVSQFTVKDFSSSEELGEKFEKALDLLVEKYRSEKYSIPVCYKWAIISKKNAS